MRIEYEGMVEQQPTYQHVGYLASAKTEIVGYEAHAVAPTLGFSVLALALLLITVRTYNRVHPFVTVLTVAGLVTCGALAVAWGTASTPIVEKYYLEPDLPTRDRLSEHASRIEDELKQTGELPDTLIYREPSDRWERKVVGTLEDPNLDAWGREFRYERYGEPNADGHRFSVISAGADGTFGTEDDLDRSLTEDEAFLMDHPEHQNRGAQ